MRLPVLGWVLRSTNMSSSVSGTGCREGRNSGRQLEPASPARAQTCPAACRARAAGTGETDVNSCSLQALQGLLRVVLCLLHRRAQQPGPTQAAPGAGAAAAGWNPAAAAAGLHLEHVQRLRKRDRATARAAAAAAAAAAGLHLEQVQWLHTDVVLEGGLGREPRVQVGAQLNHLQHTETEGFDYERDVLSEAERSRHLNRWRGTRIHQPATVHGHCTPSR